MDTPNGKRQLTRRRVLKRGATALGGGALALGGGAAGGAAQAQAPAIATGTQTGRTFRGLVRHDATLDVQEMRLLPIDPRQVVIRSLAVAPCYTIVRGALATNPIRRAEVPNHCGFGVVEAIGPMVKRVQVGDRVVVAGTSQCGQCYQCLHGRPDYCQFTFFSNAPGVEPFAPFAQFRDGTPVYAQAGIGGMSEIMTAFEEYCVPVFTDLPAAQLTLLGDQLASGFAAGHADMVFQPGSDVVVFGAGPVGLGAVQAARVMGAGQVIVVDPIKYRREFAMKMGATTTLDANAEGDGIVERIRELCRGPERSPLCRRHDVGTGRQRRDVARCRLRGRGRGAGDDASEDRAPARPDQRQDRAAGVGLHQRGRPRDAHGIHAAAGALPRRVAGAPRPHDSPRPAGRVARDARHPALREADREGEDRRAVGDHQALHARSEPAGRAGHGRPDHHHRRDRFS